MQTLTDWFYSPDAEGVPRVRKTVLDSEGNEIGDASRRGAFPFGVSVRFDVELPRLGGWTGISLVAAPDGGCEQTYPLRFTDTDRGTDRYSVTFPTDTLFPDAEDGLLYYQLVFFSGNRVRYSDTSNNVDFGLSDTPCRRFRMLVYHPGFHTPEWFRKGMMYHVFVDRFRKGEGAVGIRADAELETDWENGIPQFAPYPGAPLENNRFFGGNLWGVAEKLDYLVSMGVNIVYLSPVFRAYSNHKYDTGDYETVDEMFGGEPALLHLLGEAKKRGVHVILDGVFNHTGDDSKYFNRYGKYPGQGAYQSPDSPYHDWFCFRNFPDDYESWWGIRILPKLNPASESCRRYFTGPGGIIQKYLEMGVSGWRLDVADELTDEFLDELRVAAKSVSPDAVIIGEVWENAADKVAYGRRRRYFRGGQLDSVMNYPLRTAILAFVLGRRADALYDTLTELYGSYPPEVADSLMNLLGTHDTERILTVLGSSPEDYGGTNEALSRRRLSPGAREFAVKMLKIAATIQFTVFGIPSVYYGDEAGMEGYHDPFCRMPYPWGRENLDLREYYRALGGLRKAPAFHGGEFRFLGHGVTWIAYERIPKGRGARVAVVANRGDVTVEVSAPGTWTDAFTGEQTRDVLFVEPDRARVWKRTHR